jgi:hypothetical protein
MRHSEYERRRSTLEQQLQEDLELIRAGYRAKLRALEMLWLAPSSAAEGELAAEKPAPEEAQTRSETQGAAETHAWIETQAPETQGSETRRPEATPVPQGGLWEAIQDALPQLPEIFDRHELEKALGFTPRKSTLARILNDMSDDKDLEIVERSHGRHPTKYRKVAGPA